jgi:hypothetical protein
MDSHLHFQVLLYYMLVEAQEVITITLEALMVLQDQEEAEV